MINKNIAFYFYEKKNQQHADCNSLVMRYEAKKVKTRFDLVEKKKSRQKKIKLKHQWVLSMRERRCELTFVIIYFN